MDIEMFGQLLPEQANAPDSATTYGFAGPVTGTLPPLLSHQLIPNLGHAIKGPFVGTAAAAGGPVFLGSVTAITDSPESPGPQTALSRIGQGRRASFRTATVKLTWRPPRLRMIAIQNLPLEPYVRGLASLWRSVCYCTGLTLAQSFRIVFRHNWSGL
jgi:hypothetical protein